MLQYYASLCKVCKPFFYVSGKTWHKTNRILCKCCNLLFSVYCHSLQICLPIEDYKLGKERRITFIVLTVILNVRSLSTPRGSQFDKRIWCYEFPLYLVFLLYEHWFYPWEMVGYSGILPVINMYLLCINKVLIVPSNFFILVEKAKGTCIAMTHVKTHYVDSSVLLENAPFEVMSEDIDNIIFRFSRFFCELSGCLLDNKKKITHLLEEMNFIFLYFSTWKKKCFISSV